MTAGFGVSHNMQLHIVNGKLVRNERYHIVSLLLLAEGVPVSDRQEASISVYAPLMASAFVARSSGRSIQSSVFLHFV